jgi:hypothetical protein
LTQVDAREWSHNNAGFEGPCCISSAVRDRSGREVPTEVPLGNGDVRVPRDYAEADDDANDGGIRTNCYSWVSNTDR